MSLYKPSKSPYWVYDFSIKGVRYTASTRVRDKATARKLEAEARREAVTPTRARPSITVDEAAGLYALHADKLPSWPDTKRIVKILVAALGPNKALAAVTQFELIRLVSERRKDRANSSVNRELNVWRAMWLRADRAKFDVGDMPVWGDLLLTEAGIDPRTFSDDEEARLFEALRPDLQDFAKFALASGWRLSEVIRLTWRDVDLDARVARTKIKGGDTIERPLSASMVALIKAQPRVAVQVFTYVAQTSRSKHVAKDGRKRAHRVKGERYPLSRNGWRKPWINALADAGIEHRRFHDLRHTRGTRVLKATGNLAVTQRALAHKAIKTTLRYAHVLSDDIRDGLDASDIRPNPRTITEKEIGVAEYNKRSRA